jgi:hypothetical protein
VGVACCSTAAFFYYGDHGRGTNAQHAGGVADAAAINSHVNDLAADLRHAAAILILQEKDTPRIDCFDTDSVGCRWLACRP